MKRNSTKAGIDFFDFFLVTDGILPNGMPQEGVWANALETYLERFPNFGYLCTGWIIVNKNMDYLHCREKLSWKGKTKCKE